MDADRVSEVERVGPGRPSASRWRVTSWDAVAVTSTLLGVTIVLGRVGGVVPVAIASVLWLGTVLFLVGDVLVRQARRWNPWNWVFVVGVGAATLRMCSLGLLQTFGGRSSLYWNVDGRYFATLAQGISRFSGFGDSLEYAGARTQYHAGPSWVAGSLHGVFGIPIDFTLFLVVPAACMVVISAFGWRLLRQFGASAVAATVGVAVALNLPRDPIQMFDAALHGGAKNALLNPSSWIFTASLIANALFAMALAFAGAWALLSDRGWFSLVVGGTSLAALVGLKPQFLPAFIVLVGPVYVLQAWRRTRTVPWKRVGATAVWVGALAVVFMAANPQIIDVSSFELEPAGVYRGLVDSQPFGGRVTILAALAILAMVAVPAIRRLQDPRLVASSEGVLVGGVVAAIVLASTTLLLSADAIRHAAEIGFRVGRDFMDSNFDQALIPIGLVLAMVAVAQLTVVARSFGGAIRFAPIALFAVVVLATFPNMESALRFPTGRAAHEWTDEAALARLYDQVDVTDGVWLSSDLADSADGFARPMRAVNLTSLAPAQFYLSNVEYTGWARDDVAKRVARVRRFFETDWSSWHDRFLRRHGIRYVLVRDRCPPAWGASDFPGSVVGHRGDWTLLDVKGSSGAGSDRGWPEFADVPGYGSSPCLAFPSA